MNSFLRRSTTPASFVASALAFNPFSAFAATNVVLNGPQGLAPDVAVHHFISEFGCAPIRHVDKNSGIITPVPTTGVYGDTGDGGLSTDAQIGTPWGATVDIARNFYSTDFDSSRVHKIEKATGLIRAVASTDQVGFGDINNFATNTALFEPQSVAVDVQGNVFIADTGNKVVEKVDAATGRIHGMASHFSTWAVVLAKPLRVTTTLLGNCALRLAWPGPVGGVLETSTNLAPNSWLPAGGSTQQPDGSWQPDVSPGELMRFYRLMTP